MKTLFEVIQNVDNLDENKQFLKESLTNLLELAKSKSALLANDIEKNLMAGKTSEQHIMPITCVIANSASNCVIQEENNKISEVIDEVKTRLQSLSMTDNKVVNAFG